MPYDDRKRAAQFYKVTGAGGVAACAA